jgi:hypothetical protein
MGESRWRPAAGRDAPYSKAGARKISARDRARIQASVRRRQHDSGARRLIQTTLEMAGADARGVESRDVVVRGEATGS